MLDIHLVTSKAHSPLLNCSFFTLASLEPNVDRVEVDGDICQLLRLLRMTIFCTINFWMMG